MKPPTLYPSSQTSTKETPSCSPSPLPAQPPSLPDKQTGQRVPKTKKNVPPLLPPSFLSTIFLPALLWFFIWWGCALHVGQELLLPSPFLVAERLALLMGTTEFWRHVFATLGRITAGMLGGSLLGVLLALLTYFFPVAHHFFALPLKTLQATPVVSFILLVLLWVERNQVPAVVSGMMVLPLLWSSTRKGLEQTNQQLLEVGRAYQFSPLKTFFLIYAPCVLPYVSTACSNAMALAWKSGVAAEVICLPSLAMGKQLQWSKLYLDTPSLFAWTVVVIVLSSLMEGALKYLLSKKSRAQQEVT